MRPEPPLHDGQGRASPSHPSIDGRRSRWTTVDIAPDLVLRVLEADDDDQLEAALAAPPADPYAGILWPASIAAAAEIASLVSPGQTVIDLGAGTGLVALTAAYVGARALALDHDPYALSLIERAAAEQGLDLETQPFDLMGADPLPDTDIIVISDLLYEVDLASAAAHRTIEALDAGAHTLVADPGRIGRYTYEQTLKALGIEIAFNSVEVHAPGDAPPQPVEIAWIGPGAIS